MNGLAICAGVGGLELGLDLALPEYRCVCYIERETYPAAVLVSRMAEGALDAAPIWDDLETFDGRPWRGVVDLISAGFPCQPWSTAGDQQGTDDARWLWPSIARIVRDIRPEYLFLENVPNLLNGGLDPILIDLACIGYDAVWDLFSAGSVGAPHIRKRLFILARRRDINPDANGCGCGMGGSEPETSRCREQPQEGSEPQPCREIMANPNGGGRPRKDVYVRQGGQVQAPAEIARGRKEMADPDSERLSPTWAIGERSSQPSPKSPGNGWERWIVEPDVGRVADGVPSRVDRIRALGNAVVPAVAALAFQVLKSRLIR